MQYEFGSGVMWAIPTLTLAGAAVTVPTPVPFGAMQDVSIDITSSVKELYGLKQFPLAVARGTAKVSGKAKAARITAAFFNQLFGETPASTSVKANYQESLTIANNSATVANNSTFTTDLGVIYGATGLPLTRAAAAAPGSYAVSAGGVYTFDPTDVANNAVLKASYAFTNNASPNQIITLNNQLLGTQPQFKLILNQNFQGKQLTLTLNRCVGTKLTIATKLEDFTIPEFDFSAMVDDSDVLGTISTAE